MADKSERNFPTLLMVSLIVVSLAIGFTLGYLIDHANDIGVGNDNHGPRIELVDYSINKTYPGYMTHGGRIFHVKVSNLGDEIGNSTIKCDVLASIVVPAGGGVNKTVSQWFNASKEIRLAPSETVTVTLNVDFATHSYYFQEYVRYPDGSEYFQGRLASFEYHCYLD